MPIDARSFMTEMRLSPLGPPVTGLVENTRAAFAAGKFVDRSVSAFFNLRNSYNDYLDEVEEKTGTRFENPMDALAVPTFGVSSVGADNRARMRAAQKLDEDLKKLHAADPSFTLKTMDTLHGEIAAEAQALVGEEERIASRQTTLGAVGQFAGAAGSALVDPPIAASLAFGAPLAAGLVRTAILESLIAGTVEALVQPQIQLYRQELGLESGVGQAAGRVAIAAGAGGVFGASFKLAGLGFRKMLGIADETKALKTKGQRDAGEVLRRHLEAQDDAPTTSRDPDAVAAYVRDLDAAALNAREGRLTGEDEIPSVERGGPTPAERRAAIEAGRPTAAGRAAQPDVVREIQNEMDEIAVVLRRIEGAKLAEPEADVSPLGEMLAMLRGKRKLPDEPESLLEFIRRQGGISSKSTDTAEVRTLGVTARTHPTLINKGGQPLDELGLRAHEAGFFLERPERQQILDALDDEINRGRPMIRPDEADIAMQHEALQALQEALDRSGVDLSLPDADVERQLDAFFRGTDELMNPGGPEVARATDPKVRGARAREHFEALENIDEVEIAAANEVEFIRQLEDNPDMDVPVGIERDPETGEFVTVTRRASEVLEEFDKDDAFITQFEGCVG